MTLMPRAPKLILADTNPEVLEAWTLQFAHHPDVEIRAEDPLGVAGDAIFLPGNSFGFLDSGLELRVLETLGFEVQDDLRDRIRRDFQGELLLGQAVWIRRESIPRTIVYAPIWRSPERIAETINVFLAARGVFLALGASDAPACTTLVVPELGTGPVGAVDPRVSARQLRYAWEMARGERGTADKNLTQATRRARKLRSVPVALKEEGED
jgi:O-acetyl-ADP-ribose deacetylase (regulator of RNase III)